MDRSVVGPGYFRTVGVALLHGRTFTPDDTDGIAVISELATRRPIASVTPNANAIGSAWDAMIAITKPIRRGRSPPPTPSATGHERSRGGSPKNSDSRSRTRRSCPW